MKEKSGNGNIKKPFYKRWWFWIIIIVLFAAVIGNTGNGGEDNTSTDSSTEQTEVNNSSKSETEKLPAQAEVICRALTEKFVENVVGEKYSMLAFSVEDYELDDNENGTIMILYMPTNAGNGATKVNLTIVKNGNAYQIEYALLSGIDEVDMSTVSNNFKTLVDQ